MAAPRSHCCLQVCSARLSALRTAVIFRPYVLGRLLVGCAACQPRFEHASLVMARLLLYSPLAVFGGNSVGVPFSEYNQQQWLSVLSNALATSGTATHQLLSGSGSSTVPKRALLQCSVSAPLQCSVSALLQCSDSALLQCSLSIMSSVNRGVHLAILSRGAPGHISLSLCTQQDHLRSRFLC